MYLILSSILVFYLGQIDWAALAQAWIAQREATGQGVVEPQGMIPNGQDLPPPVPQMEPVPNNHNFQSDPNFNRMWQPGNFATVTQIIIIFFFLQLIDMYMQNAL